MEPELPKQLAERLGKRASELGINIETAIHDAVVVYVSRMTSKVSDSTTGERQLPRLGMSSMEAATSLGISVKTILRLVARGLLKPMPDSNRRYIFSAKEIERYVEESANRSPRKTTARRSLRNGGRSTRR